MAAQSQNKLWIVVLLMPQDLQQEMLIIVSLLKINSKVLPVKRERRFTFYFTKLNKTI